MIALNKEGAFEVHPNQPSGILSLDYLFVDTRKNIGPN